jgi:hypothetical protein
MTTASLDAFKKLTRPRISEVQVIQWVKEYGPITAHDLCDLLQAKNLLNGGGQIVESGQVWSEVSARISNAAKNGLLADDETVETTFGTKRTLYRWLDKPRGVRLSKAERLEEENKKLQAEIKELTTKLEVCRATIDRLNEENENLAEQVDGG